MHSPMLRPLKMISFKSLLRMHRKPFATFAARRMTIRAAPKEATSPEDMKRMTYRSLAIFLASGLGLMYYFRTEKERLELQRKEEAESKKTIGLPTIGGPFALVDHEGIPRTDLDYAGKYMLLYFGYTFCPDVCPEELDKMAEIIDSLNKNGFDKSTIVPIFVSCDPKRDSLQSIKEYIKDFHPQFIGMTGTYEQIKRVAKHYRLYFSAPPRAVDDDDSDYLVDHSIFFYLVGPDGKYVAHYGRNDTAETVADKIKDIMALRRKSHHL